MGEHLLPAHFALRARHRVHTAGKVLCRNGQASSSTEPAALKLTLEAHQPADQRVVPRVRIAGVLAPDGVVERKLRVPRQSPPRPALRSPSARSRGAPTATSSASTLCSPRPSASRPAATSSPPGMPSPGARIVHAPDEPVRPSPGTHPDRWLGSVRGPLRSYRSGGQAPPGRSAHAPPSPGHPGGLSRAPRSIFASACA